MPRDNFDALEQAVVQASRSNTWTTAVLEWEVVGLEEDAEGEGVCVCGHPELVKLFTIENRRNGAILHLIGSVCVNHFGREDLDRDINVLRSHLALRTAVRQGKAIDLTSEFFTRAMLEDLYEQSAFGPDQYNGGDGENDVDFLLKMFNKRDKTAITRAQRWKIRFLLRDKVVPFIEGDPRLR